ncbi:helix-turn-helix domain-containing protein [Bifidobacterium breve]|uniref:helix-turn-helix domain-containing protein n=1 Tax=Bifidobacterium breve TaxID=1685 RepID=UPI003D0573B4
METGRKDFRMSGPEERERAVGLYFTTPMTTAQVVEHLGYPARQCLERWLAMDPRYAGHMAKPIIPPETRTKAIEPVPDGMQWKQAAELFGAGVSAVHNRVKAYREGGMAALRPRSRNAGQANKPAMRRDRDAGDAEALRQRIEELELGNGVMREVVEARGKRPGCRPAAPVGQGEDATGRLSAPDVFTQLDDMLARHRTEQPPTAATPGSPLTDTPGSGRRWRRRSPLPRAGTGTAGSGPRSKPASRRRRSAGSWPRMV